MDVGVGMSMKPTLEDLRRSAEFCRHNTLINNADGICWIDGASVSWNPPEKAEQDRELLHKLLEARWTIHYRPHGIHLVWRMDMDGGKDAQHHIECHPNHFLTLAASKLQEMKDD